jgi:hypothetical protein
LVPLANAGVLGSKAERQTGFRLDCLRLRQASTLVAPGM